MDDPSAVPAMGMSGFIFASKPRRTTDPAPIRNSAATGHTHGRRGHTELDNVLDLVNTPAGCLRRGVGNIQPDRGERASADSGIAPTIAVASLSENSEDTFKKSLREEVWAVKTGRSIGTQPGPKCTHAEKSHLRAEGEKSEKAAVQHGALCKKEPKHLRLPSDDAEYPLSILRDSARRNRLLHPPHVSFVSLAINAVNGGHGHKTNHSCTKADYKHDVHECRRVEELLEEGAKVKGNSAARNTHCKRCAKCKPQLLLPKPPREQRISSD